MLTPLEVATRYSVPLNIAEAALKNIASGEVLLLTVSGRIGAGKDTVAPVVVERLGYHDAVHESFARPLREEVNEVIACIQEASSFEEAMNLVRERLTPTNFEVVVRALYEDVKAGVVTSSYQRTASTRRALQWWGTEVRRAVDNDYWVKKAMRESLYRLAEGTSIYVTDSRFPNEASAITDLGGVLLRLSVSEAEQRRRIMARDGIEPNEEALTHISETAMDTYPFTNIVDTDKLDKEAVLEASCKATRRAQSLVK